MSGEIRFDGKERRRLEDMGDLYSIIKTVQHLEKAYVRDSVLSEEYTNACQRLIAQFKTTEAAIRSDPQFAGTEAFIREFQMDCPLAHERLLVAGVPATVIYAHTDKSKDASIAVAEATQWFITAMDVLKLDQRAVDEIQPNISDLVKVLNKCETIAPGFDKAKLQNWLIKLNAMRASEELTDDQVRELLFDLDSSYAAFKSALSQSL